MSCEPGEQQNNDQPVRKSKFVLKRRRKSEESTGFNFQNFAVSIWRETRRAALLREFWLVTQKSEGNYSKSKQ
jgi:hypothetical protein